MQRPPGHRQNRRNGPKLLPDGSTRAGSERNCHRLARGTDRPARHKADQGRLGGYGRKVKSRVIKFCHSKGMAEEGEHDDIPTASEAAHYRGLAHSLRELARQCRIARARLELVQLAVKLEQRAERLEQGRR